MQQRLDVLTKKAIHVIKTLIKNIIINYCWDLTQRGKG